MIYVYLHVWDEIQILSLRDKLNMENKLLKFVENLENIYFNVLECDLLDDKFMVE